MNIINAATFGIVPGKEIGELIPKLFSEIKNDSPTKIIFQKGTYYIDSDSCEEHMLYITNTAGDSEYTNSEAPHLQKAAFYLNNLSDLTIDGGGSVFIISGKMTNFVMENCENICLKNIELRHSHPDMHELRVTKKTAFSVTFAVDKSTDIIFKDSKPYFQGKGFLYPADKGATTANWIPLIRQDDLSLCRRVKHPLSGAFKYKKEEKGFSCHYLNTSPFKVGDRFYIYDVRRQFAGIFINKCEGISLYNIKQCFNYSLALVLQCSSNITVKDSVFAPDEDSGRLMCSCADFIQGCMCEGLIHVQGCEFLGAGDDCMNIHGIHFKVAEIKGNAIKIKFMHPQTHGFNPIKEGDTVAFIDTKTLKERSSAKVISSDSLNENEILLTLDEIINAKTGDALENVTACPQVIFKDNKISRIVTRGLLLTTRGKVQIENNTFISNAMSGILISDDANSWYESGMCKDVLIKGNTFIKSGEPTILIKPENKSYEGAVHENIRIIDNTFPTNAKCCVSAYSADNILIMGNAGLNKGSVKAKCCQSLKIE